MLIDKRFLESNFPGVSFAQRCVSFSTVSGSTFSTFGVCTLSVSFQSTTENVQFFVIDTPVQLIIGVDGVCQLNVSLKFQNSGNLLLTVNSASDNESRKEAFLSLFDFSTVAYPNNIHELKMLLWKYNDIFFNK